MNVARGCHPAEIQKAQWRFPTDQACLTILTSVARTGAFYPGRHNFAVPNSVGRPDRALGDHANVVAVVEAPEKAEAERSFLHRSERERL